MSDDSRETTRQIAWVTSGLVSFFITLMVLVYRDCSETDARRLECVKLGKVPAECHDLFSGNRR